jgi:fermentation-respiration switch protein FrsA (DUF1100 family)
MTAISSETVRIGTIPVLRIRPTPPGPMPLVFFIHGYGSRKEDGAELGERLARSGIGFAAFDCWLHRDRGDDGSAVRRFAAVYPEDTGLNHYVLMHEVAAQAAHDVETLAAALQNDGASMPTASGSAVSRWAASPRSSPRPRTRK